MHARRTVIAGLAALLVSGTAFAFVDDFAAPLSTSWAVPDTPLAGSSVTAPVSDLAASDGAVLELIYPGGTASSYSGPAWATQLQTSASRGYGVYEARLRAAAARGGAGMVSAFFTYFNDGIDHDGDGIIDNDEIDLEFLAAEPSAIYLTVWTQYQADASGEVFRKVTRKVNLSNGRVWQTPPGGEGTYDLVPVAPLGWRAYGFNSTRRYRTYRFDWEATQVTFSVDLEDGRGWRTLWTLTGAPDVVIPSHVAPCFVNLWHNASAWNTGRVARPPHWPVSFRVDRVAVP